LFLAQKGYSVRNPIPPLLLSYSLVFVQTGSAPAVSGDHQSQSVGQQQKPPAVAPAAEPIQPAPTPSSSDTAKTLLPGQFILQDATPIRLRLNRNVSSADAHVGDSVDFEVLEDVAANGIVVIPKGSVAIGTVTEAQPKRRMGRAGKLEIVLDYVRLADTEKAAVRAVKDAKGGSHTVGMTVGIVATGLLFFPAAPFFLFMHGKDITVPKGAEITAYVNGDVRLETKNFHANDNQGGPSTPAPQPATASSQAGASSPPPAVVPTTGTVEVNSTPEGADVYADGAFIGNAPAILKLAPGNHTIRVSQSGFKEWSREVAVEAGSEAHLSASLDKQD
jgi:PEGA domain